MNHHGVAALLLGCALLSCARVSAGGLVPADQEPLAAGQLLAKFASGEATDNEVVRLLASGETASDRLDAIIEQLGDTLDVPLFVRQITSGRELVLEIDRSKVLDMAASRLSEAPDVHAVRIDRVEGVQRYWQDRLLLELAAGSDLARTAALVNDERAAQTVQRQLSKRLRHAHYVVATQVISPQRIALRIDLQATTLNLVKALQAQTYVEYAQPNFVATIN